MKIAFVGGGTLGPVTPLLAVARSIKRLAPQTKCFWIGTPSGPEKSLVEAEGIPFFSLPVFKFPRYVSLAWFTLPFRWFRVRSMATTLIEEQKPDAIVGMGGYTSVPVMRAARQTAIPCFTHQLDLLPLLSNRLIAKKCVSVTTSFEYEQRPFGPNVLDEPIATPSRFSLSDLPSRAEAIKFFHLHERKPVVFMFGGGTGAQAMNEMLERTWSAWHKMAQVIHLTGTGKKGVIHADVSAEIFDQEHMLHAYAAADIVIARAGIGTLSEVAALKKPVILIPLPSAHQEANARAFEEQGAALVIQQGPSMDQELVQTAETLLADRSAQKMLGEQAHTFFLTDDGGALAKKILKEL